MESFVTFIGIIAQFATILGLIVIIFQIRQTTKWNRRASNYNFLNTEISAKLEIEVRRKIESVGIIFQYGSSWQLTEQDCKQLISNHDTAFSINQFLNDYQNLCAAFQENILDKKMFKKIHSGRLLFWYNILSNYINEAKTLYKDTEIWGDFVETAKEILKERP